MAIQNVKNYQIIKKAVKACKKQKVNSSKINVKMVKMQEDGDYHEKNLIVRTNMKLTRQNVKVHRIIQARKSKRNQKAAKRSTAAM